MTIMPEPALAGTGFRFAIPPLRAYACLDGLCLLLHFNAPLFQQNGMVHWLHTRAVINDTPYFDSAVIAENLYSASAVIAEKRTTRKSKTKQFSTIFAKAMQNVHFILTISY